MLPMRVQMAFDLDYISGWFDRTIIIAHIEERSFLDEKMIYTLAGYLMVDTVALNKSLSGISA